VSLERFVQLWTDPELAPLLVSESRIRQAEARLGARLPRDYRDAVLQFGLPRPTIALLDWIVDHEAAVHDVGDFLAPDEIVETTEGWRQLGLPDDLIAFATDSCGNLFCFVDRSDASPVIFFDHDFGTTKAVASSFTDWIESYCALQPP
jgi:cell wall assembly regulator SMI1